MDNDGKFFVACWSLLAGVICVITIAIVTYNIYSTNRIARMIEAGADPIKVNCAMYGGTGGIDCNLIGRK